MDWAVYQSAIRFDIRAERAEYERLFNHHARMLQDRLDRRGRTDRTKLIAVPEWEKVYQTQARERKLLHQARVLGWGKEKVLLCPQARLATLGAIRMREDWTVCTSYADAV